MDRIQLYTAKKTMHRVHSAAHSKFIDPVPEDAREGAAPASCASRSSSTQHSLILFFRNHYILGEESLEKSHPTVVCMCAATKEKEDACTESRARLSFRDTAVSEAATSASPSFFW